MKGNSFMGWRFWIDRGGTFTDLVGISPVGELVVHKFLSEQPDQKIDPAVKTIRGILKINDNIPIPKAMISEVRIGTTVATNALLEGTGKPVLLFCNKGFSDALFIGDQHRQDLFSLRIVKPPFIAKSVIELNCRIDTNGFELQKLELECLVDNQIILNCLKEQTSCAISFLHSYINPRHEIALQKWLKSIGFKNVICSHQVAPLPRFIPRGQTTLVEATVSPILFEYLVKVRKELGESTNLRIMGSSGTLLHPDLLYAKDTILSGPAGGMVGAVASANMSGLNTHPLVGFDMGGTSTDVFYVPPKHLENFERDSETEIAGYALIAQRLPIHTVAAGGGSVISLNGERLQVGPFSAGSNPGPACYRRGGPLTITDANLFLGRIQKNKFPQVFGLDGNQAPDYLVTKKGFSKLANKLRISPEEVAEGALSIAVEKMADAIKQVSLFSGYDIRNGVLLAFGGAGGQHVCRLARQLGIKKILLHPLASVLSAYGIGIACQTKFITLHIREDLTEELLLKLKRLCNEEHRKAEIKLDESGDLNDIPQKIKSKCLIKVEIRFKSSEQGLMIAFDKQSRLDDLIKSFELEHLKRFSYIPPRNEQLVIEKLEIEVIPITSSQSYPISYKASGLFQSHELARVYLSESGWQEIPCYSRENLSSDLDIQGPALIVDSTSSIFLEVGWQAKVDTHGCLLLEADFSNLLIKYYQGSSSIIQPDSVLLELYRHRFTSIAKKMGERLKKTSRSVNIRERMDFSCALFDKQGCLVANAPHIPVHLGSMGETVVELIREISSGKRPPLHSSETILTNDPFKGGTHLPDITAITPVFAGSDEPLFYVACRGHHEDIGGITPGSMPPFSKTIHDEGLLLCNETFIFKGKYNSLYWGKRILSCKFPPRNPTVLIADLHAQVAANQLGVNELENLVEAEGYEEVFNYMNYLQANASSAVKKVIKNLKETAFSVDLDNGARLFLRISINDKKNKVKLDFTGTSKQGHQNFQAPLAVTKAVVLYAFRCLLDEEIPLNSGCFEPIELIVPKGCLLNPIPPAAVVAGNVETSQAICNLIFGAMGVLAASQGTMNNLTFGNSDKQYYETIAGGSGAGNGFDGCDCIQSHMTNSRLTDPEIIEQRYPVRLEHFGIRKGSGGEGRWRGGEGLLRKFLFLEPMNVSILSGSRRISPFGLAGGKSGRKGLNQLQRSNGEKLNLDGCSSFEVEAGDSVLISTPGGGGYGEPNL